MSKTRSSGHRCIYTGRAADTRDHVPPKCLLERPYPANLDTVPCSRSFNGESSKDEQYFLVIAAHLAEGSALEDRLDLGGALERALLRKPALDERLIESLSVDSSGAVHLAIEQNRVEAVLRKVAAGLHFLVFGEAPGIDAFGEAQLLPSAEQFANLIVGPGLIVHRTVQPEVFEYAFLSGRHARLCAILIARSLTAVVVCPGDISAEIRTEGENAQSGRG